MGYRISSRTTCGSSGHGVGCPLPPHLHPYPLVLTTTSLASLATLDADNFVNTDEPCALSDESRGGPRYNL